MKAFWTKMKRHQSIKTNSQLTADELAMHYRTVMSDDNVLNGEQETIKSFVDTKTQMCCDYKQPVSINPERIDELLKQLNNGAAPGADGVTVEHFLHGLSPALLSALSDIYSATLSSVTVPQIFTTGIVIPIIKKSSCDPNSPNNYRPITLSSVHSKVVELLIAPTKDICDTQFGFRAGRGTTFATSIIHDSASYFKQNGSPLYICTLDAEKCFDSIWHDALLFKLFPAMSLQNWLFIAKWYKSSKAVVRWHGKNSLSFPIQRGMRQGSILSPALFSVFLDELLVELQHTSYGITVAETFMNSVAYADDVTVFSSTVPGLQKLIDICHRYAGRYRFKFGEKKSKCLVIGKSLVNIKPTWKLGDKTLNTETEIDILGVTFNQELSYNSHVQKRLTSTRRKIIGLTSTGMSYPGLASDVKSYLWNTIGAPTLSYGMDSIALSVKDNNILKSAQGSIIKKALGFSKRSRHTSLLQALKIPAVPDLIKRNTAGLFHRIFKICSPARKLQSSFLANYLLSGQTVKNSLLDRVIKAGYSPVELLLKPPRTPLCSIHDGIVDSLQFLVLNDNFMKPYSNEHFIAGLLLKAF
jgi:hypothetical protein